MDQPLHDFKPYQVGHANSHRIVSVGAVALFHIVAIYLLASGLAMGLLEKLPTEFKAEVIPPKQEVVKPPPPPPPELQKPPPPFVPPPDITIQTEAAPTNTITVQKNFATPPPPPAPPAPPKPAGITAPVQIAGSGARCNSSYYPAIAVRLNQTGTVLVTVHIGADGSVQNVDVAQSSGHDSLDQATVRCITSTWRYKPALQNGAPVATTKEYAVKWVLQ